MAARRGPGESLVIFTGLSLNRVSAYRKDSATQTAAAPVPDELDSQERHSRPPPSLCPCFLSPSLLVSLSFLFHVGQAIASLRVYPSSSLP